MRALRKVLGKSQVQFGAMIGVQAITIKRIENDSLPMSKKLARRIEDATGAEGSEMLKGEAGLLLNTIGEPYTTADFTYWENSSRVSVDAQAKERAADLSFWLGIVLDAAAATGQAKFRGVAEVISETLAAVVTDFRLEPQVKAALEPHAMILPHPEQTFRVEQLFNPHGRRPAPGPWQFVKELPHPGQPPPPKETGPT